MCCSPAAQEWASPRSFGRTVEKSFAKVMDCYWSTHTVIWPNRSGTIFPVIARTTHPEARSISRPDEPLKGQGQPGRSELRAA